MVGTLYRGERARPSTLAANPAFDRLIAATPGGISILARDDPGGGPGALILTIHDASGQPVATLTLDAKGLRVQVKSGPG